MHAVHTAGGRRRPRGRWVLPLAVAGAAVLAAAPASAVVQHDALHEQRYADVDVRTGSVAPTAEQQEIARRLGARVRWNELGSPQSLIRDDGFLATGVQGQDAEAAARAFVADNLALFRLSSLDTLELANDAELTGGGHAVVFGQAYGGRPSAPEGTLTVGLTRAADGWQVAYASSTLSGDETLTARRSAQISAAEAWTAAARAVGVNASVAQLRSQSRRAGWTRLNVSGAPDGLVREVAFPTADRGAVPAFETYVDRSAGESYRQIVDASSGDVLFREGATDHAVDDPHWKVFPAYPRSGLDRFPWNYPSSDIRDVWCWTGEGDAPERCDMAVADSVPEGHVEWDKDARTNQPTFTTIGNNARAGENWQSSSEPQPVQYRPTSTTRDYIYPWDNVWYEDRCDPSNFTPRGNDIDSAAVNLHAMHNRMHDWAYHLGFTEKKWNGQDHNYGRGGAENDALIGNAQAGGVSGGAPTYSGRDNANMSTRPDGTPSRTNMYLWQPIAGTFYAPCVDGDFDMSVIAHEYGHMIENRMIGKGNRRAGFHAGAMGESVADLMAMEYISEWDFARTASADPTLVGRYVTGNDDHAIRNYDMDFATAGEFPEPEEYPEIDPLNFGDVGYDFTGPQVHADGEIWSATNYDIRELFTQRYGSGGTRLQRECASGQRPAEQCPGNRRWIQIVFDSFLLMPSRPTFLDARDAQLAADRMRFGGANQDLLWRAFARRGFGEQAATADADDSEPTPDFSSPLEGEETVRFEAVAKDEGRRPVSARIYVGHYEARVSPIADTDPATVGANLDDVARFVADDGGRERTTGQRGYEFVAHAPGYGHVRFRLDDIDPGDTRTVRIEFPTNWASQSKGATATGDGAFHQDLIDDTENTNWESVGAPAQGRQVLVRLAGRREIDLAKVSAMLMAPQAGDPPPRASQNRFTALRSFELYACSEGRDRRNPTCDPADDDGFRRIVRSGDDAFPAMPPRPVAPELILRTWSASETSATHVLFRVLDNQCTGQEAYHGEQDNDPANGTDCRVGGPLPPRSNEVRAAELQLFSSRPTVRGAEEVD